MFVKKLLLLLFVSSFASAKVCSTEKVSHQFQIICADLSKLNFSDIINSQAIHNNLVYENCGISFISLVSDNNSSSNVRLSRFSNQPSPNTLTSASGVLIVQELNKLYTTGVFSKKYYLVSRNFENTKEFFFQKCQTNDKQNVILLSSLRNETSGVHNGSNLEVDYSFISSEAFTKFKDKTNSKNSTQADLDFINHFIESSYLSTAKLLGISQNKFKVLLQTYITFSLQIIANINDPLLALETLHHSLDESLAKNFSLNSLLYPKANSAAAQLKELKIQTSELRHSIEQLNNSSPYATTNSNKLQNFYKKPIFIFAISCITLILSLVRLYLIFVKK